MTTTFDSRPLFDLFDPMLQTDRYAYYRRLREADPIHRTSSGIWVITRYEDAETVLRAPGATPSFTDDPEWVRARGGPDSPAVRSVRRWMLLKDGAEHRRLRRLTARALTPASMERLRPRIAELTNEMIDAMGEGEADLIGDLALPLPVVVVCEMLGIPTEDAHMCREWTDAICDAVDPAGVTPQTQARLNRAVPEFRDYMLEQLDLRRAHPRNDVMSMFLQSDADGERLSDEDIAAQVMVLFNASHETTVNVIGNGMHALLTHPEQLQLLRDRPELAEEGFEELARYNSAVQIVIRRLTEDVRVRDTTIPAGAAVFIAIGATHRDPDKFPDPDRFDLTRTGIRSMIFGSGPHACIAATLGKLEVVMVFNELLRRYQKIELATSELEWYSHYQLGLGLKRLPLRLAYRR